MAAKAVAAVSEARNSKISCTCNVIAILQHSQRAAHRIQYSILFIWASPESSEANETQTFRIFQGFGARGFRAPEFPN